ADYRDLTGQYDKVVSIEMIEAVGAAYLPAYFGQLGRLLKPDGVALVQAITIEDRRYAQALRAVDFIKRHVFPGSFIPSMEAMLTAKRRACDLALIHLEDFGLSYARTLEAWRERFLSRRAEVRRQGFDERFIRLWEFYLAYCEGGFRERSIGVAQLLSAKPAPGAPLAWTGPVLVLIFLRWISGIPFTEAQALRSRGDDYRAYQQATPMLLPWFPKRTAPTDAAQKRTP
ncbi:MAG: class I SAM-dependent methyltransferase, partial [Gammaproteobacteria bacterium]|nr:class I SAM-dependent methyltransferase [Gammaproteobacteria bacterium]